MAVFRVERSKGYTVMSNHHLRNKELSLKAKGLLSQMLSLPEDWDYTLAGLAHINRESVDAIRTAVWELEKAGYIKRRQGRDGKGKMAAIEYIIYEQPQSDNPIPENPISENPTTAQPILENPTTDNPTSENPTELNKDILSKEKSNTDSINYPSINGDGADKMDKLKTRSEYEEVIKANIEYDIISEDKRLDRRQIDEIVAIMLDTLCSASPTVRINGTEMPTSEVAQRFLQLDSEHIEYVLFAMARSKPDIRNIRAYLTTALYNAPTTMDSYFGAIVNHDLGFRKT